MYERFLSHIWMKNTISLLKSGIKGVDRVIPIGRIMNFNLSWDGYDLPALLAYVISVEKILIVVDEAIFLMNIRIRLQGGYDR